MTPFSAQASDCSDLPPSLSHNPLTADGYQIVETTKLYRRQDRPFDFIPIGSAVIVRPPAGVTLTDLHRAVTCHIEQSSPLAVKGVKVSVNRIGDTYEVRITADKRGEALEIQHRVVALGEQNAKYIAARKAQKAQAAIAKPAPSQATAVAPTTPAQPQASL